MQTPLFVQSYLKANWLEDLLRLGCLEDRVVDFDTVGDVHHSDFLRLTTVFVE
jgi:hypothetical protein